MFTSDGAPGEKQRGESCRVEAIDAPCLLPIFEFSAPCGTHPVTSCVPLLRPVLWRLLKSKKQTPWSNSVFLQQGGDVVSNESVLQTKSPGSKVCDSQKHPPCWSVLEFLNAYQLYRWLLYTPLSHWHCAGKHNYVIKLNLKFMCSCVRGTLKICCFLSQVPQKSEILWSGDI